LCSAAAEALVVTVDLGASDQLLDSIKFATATSQSGADDGKFVFDVDGTDITAITDGGVNPGAANTQTLGDAAAEWGDLFLGDSGVVYLGSDQEVTLTHVADVGFNVKHTATADDKPIKIVMQTGETDMQANDVLGGIYFQAPDEGTGTDAVLVAAGIEAVSEGDFAADANATKLSFQTAASETAAEKMSLSSAGNLAVTGDVTVSGGNINTGNIALVVGDDTTDTITLNTDGTGDAEIVLENDSIGDAEIDWENLTASHKFTTPGLSSTSDVDITEATPTLSLIDSTDAAGTGNLLFGSSQTQDVVGTIQVDIAGSATTYMTIDGTNQQIALSPTAFAADTAWADAVKITGTFANHTTDTIEETFFFLDPTLGAPTGGTLTLNIFEIDGVTSDAQYTTINAIDIGALSSAGAGTENAINIGTGWDSSILFANAAVVTWTDGTPCTLTHVDNTGLTLNLTFQAATLTDGTASLNSGSFTGIVGIDGSGTISANLFNPDAADGADIGGTSLEFSDVYLADSSIIKWGNDQDVTITHDPDDGLTFAVAGQTNNEDLNLDLESTADTWTLSSSTGVTALTLTGITTLNMATANDPYMFLNETDGTDLYLGLNDTGNVIEFRTSATVDTAMLLGLKKSSSFQTKLMM